MAEKNDILDQKAGRDIVREILSLFCPRKKANLSGGHEQESSEGASLQHSFQHCLLRGWRRFCQLIPGIHEKVEGLVPLQTSCPAPQPHSFSAADISVISLVQAAATLLRESSQDTT